MRNLYKGIFGLSAVLFSGIGFGQTTFSFTGAEQIYTVPAGVTMISIEAYGAQGGTAEGGEGGYAYGELAVTPGEDLYVYVGGQGNTINIGMGASNGGFNGGGQGGSGISGASGGGASDVRQGGNTLADRVIVAGGGGGMDFDGSTNTPGGDGGGLTGEDGINGGGSGTPPGGGTQVAGGSGGVSGGWTATAGVLGVGGATVLYSGSTYQYGGGGGGGYYGGGGGHPWSSGAGGSSYIGGVTSGTTTIGGKLGNGEIVITELCNGLVTTVSDDTVCVGDEVILHAESTGSGVITWSGGITDSVAFTPGAGTTTYTATSSDVGDCEFSIDIFVGDYPSADAGSDVSICEGDSVQLTGTGSGTDMSWDGGVMDGVWFTPASAGTTTYTLTVTVDSTGCASTDEVDVTYNVIDATVTYSGGTLSSATSGATYQWVNCPDYSHVSGATSQDFTPTQNGDYAVIIDLGGCVDTSACETVGDVGVIDFSTDAEFAVYPNPASYNVTIKAEGSFVYSILDATGRMVMKGEGTDKVVVDLTDFETGTYMVAIQGEDNYITKLLKK